jgi:hypothetical protein
MRRARLDEVARALPAAISLRLSRWNVKSMKEPDWADRVGVCKRTHNKLTPVRPTLERELFSGFFVFICSSYSLQGKDSLVDCTIGGDSSL